MLRSSCAGDLPATLLFLLSTASVLLKWCILCLQSFIIIFFLFFVPAIIYLFAPRTVLVGADTHTYTWISCFCDSHTHTHAVVMPEDGDLKQTED